MKLSKIRLRNFRNYKDAEVCFSKGENLIVGGNAQGKSNLIEAVYCLGNAKSYRTIYDNDLVLWGAGSFFVEGEIESNGVNKTAEIFFVPVQGKVVKINKKPLAKISELIGQICIVTFAPEDLRLIKGGPDQRRAFLDSFLSQISSTYLKELVDYHKVLRQRNEVLKQINEKRSSEAELAPWTEQVLEIGSKVIWKRLQHIAPLEEKVNNVHKVLSSEKETVVLEYRASLGPAVLTKDMSETEIMDRFRAELSFKRKEEIEKSQTLVGPHRDEILIKINGHNSKPFASQGQQRSLVLSLKLAEVNMLWEISSEPPIVLLDDVFSELDSERQRTFAKLLPSDLQVFITSTEPERLTNLFPDAEQYEIKNGKVLNNLKNQKATSEKEHDGSS